LYWSPARPGHWIRCNVSLSSAPCSPPPAPHCVALVPMWLADL
jgi:hypothetical protein